MHWLAVEILLMAVAGWWAWRYADGKKRKARSEARLNRILGKS
jgi:hypothetical protein